MTLGTDATREFPHWESPCKSILLVNGDCLQVLKTLGEGTVDCVVTDPPYLNLKGGHSIKGRGVAPRRQESFTVGDEWTANLEWVEPAKSVCRLGVVVFCTYHGLPETAIAFNGFRRAVLWTWSKTNAPPSGKNVPRFTEEYAWGFAKQPGIKWDEIKTTLIVRPMLQAGCMASPERLLDETGAAVHPTQKPIAVFNAVLLPGMDIVCDPYMGTGTCPVACIRTKRRCIGIELHRPYWEIAVERCKRELDRHPLFDRPKLRQGELI